VQQKDQHVLYDPKSRLNVYLCEKVITIIMHILWERIIHYKHRQCARSNVDHVNELTFNTVARSRAFTPVTLLALVLDTRTVIE